MLAGPALIPCHAHDSSIGIQSVGSPELLLGIDAGGQASLRHKTPDETGPATYSLPVTGQHTNWRQKWKKRTQNRQNGNEPIFIPFILPQLVVLFSFKKRNISEHHIFRFYYKLSRRIFIALSFLWHTLPSTVKTEVLFHIPCVLRHLFFLVEC